MEQLGNDLSKEKPIIVLAGPDIIDFVSIPQFGIRFCS